MDTTSMTVEEFFNKVLVAAQGGDGLVLLGLALIALIWASRKLAIKYVPFFATDFGGMLFAFALSSLTVAASALAGGTGLSAELASSALTAGLIAVGGWSGVLKKLPWFAKDKTE